MKTLPIVVFKAITGEFGIGILNKEEQKIEKVLFIAIKAGSPDNINPFSKPQLMLIPPFAPISENLPSISLNYVMMYEEVTNEELSNLYLRLSTNLTLPDTNTIVNLSKKPTDRKAQSKANIINLTTFAKGK